MLYIMYFLSIITNFIEKNKRYIFILSSIFLWILAGWCFNNADTEVYRFRYSFYDTISTEFLFRQIIVLCRKAALNFENYRILLTGVFSFLLFFSIYRNSYNFNFALALYIVFPFCFNAVQLRQFAANSVILLALSILKNKEKQDIPVYLFLVFIASLLHSSSLFFVIFVFAVFFNNKQTFFVSAFFSISTYLFFSEKILEKILSIVGLERRFVNIQMTYSQISNNQKFYYIFCVIVGLFGALALLGYQKKIIRHAAEDIAIFQESNFIFRCHILTLVCIPFIMLGIVDCVRFQFALLPITFCVFSYSCSARIDSVNHMLVIERKKLLFSAGCIIYAFLLLYFWILNNGNRDSIFIALMENNNFLRWFFEVLG